MRLKYGDLDQKLMNLLPLSTATHVAHSGGDHMHMTVARELATMVIQLSALQQMENDNALNEEIQSSEREPLSDCDSQDMFEQVRNLDSDRAVLDFISELIPCSCLNESKKKYFTTTGV
jgi:hypothetical protein